MPKKEESKLLTESGMISNGSIRMKMESYQIKVEPNLEGLPVNEEHSKIFVDGDWISNTNDPTKFIKRLRALRRSSRISYQISIIYEPHTNNIHIYTDSGRCLRPLFVVEKNRLKINP